MERTLVLIKPDAVERGLVGQIVSRLERKGLRLVGLKLFRLDRGTAEEHYRQHRERTFFGELIDFITRGPLVAMVWEGRGAVEVVRSLMGATDPLQAAPGTVRGDLALDLACNLVHGSDSVQAAAREIELFFRPEELVAYRRAQDGWLGFPEA